MKSFKIKSYLGLAAFAVTALLNGCADDYPSATVNPYANDLLGLKIINAQDGNGNTVQLEGTIDEDKKTVKFPRVNITTDFSKIVVVATTSEGSKLTQDTLDFSMDDETTERTKTVRVLNHNRYKDYFVTIRKKVPLFGGDFEKVSTYAFDNTNAYAGLKTATARCSDFDGTHVLVVDRGMGPHLLKVSDVMAGNVSNPVMLNTTGISGGTFAYNMGALAGGHIYLASLAGGATSPLKIYYYENETATPECIANIDISTLPFVKARHGDNMSLTLDASGNGFIYFGANPTGEDFIRVPISAYKTVGTPEVVPVQGTLPGLCTNVYRVDGTEEYIYSGNKIGVTLADESLNAKYTVSKDNLPLEATTARVFTFNGNRYLFVTTAGFGGASKAVPGIYIFNINKGADTMEALKNFDAAEDHNPVFKYLIGGANLGYCGGNSNFFIEKDAAGKDLYLWVYAGRSTSGFAIVKVPLAKDEDE